MKRVRHEQIGAIVQHYLKRRQYLAPEQQTRKETKLTHNVDDMAFKNLLKSESSSENMLSLSSPSGEANHSEHQFNRFRKYINDSPEPYRQDLQLILLPVFVQLYLELLFNNHKVQANKFYSRHTKLFDHNVKNKATVEQIYKLSTRADMLSCKEVTDWRDNKYQIKMSEEALDYIRRYIKQEENTMIVQVFNKYVKVEVAEPECKNQQLELKENKQITNGEKLEDQQSSSESMKLLKQAIKSVREGQPSVSSICFYTYINAYQGLCSVDISSDQGMISSGFEDSSIKIWSVSPGSLQTKETDTDPSKLFLAADYWNVESEESSPKYEESVTLKAHNGAVYKTCFFNQLPYLLSGSEDGSVRLWDLDSFTNKVCYKGHNYPVWDIDISNSNDYFTSCSQDRTAKLWTTDRIYPLRSFVGHTADIDCVKFHPNSNYIATGSSDRTVRLWSLQDGKSVRLMQGHRGTILALAFSQNGQYLASAGDDRRIRVWDLNTGTLFKELRGHTETVHALSFNKDSTLLASGGIDCCIKAWDVRKGVNNNNTVVDGHTSAEMIGSYQTKSATVIWLNYTKHNVLQAAGTV
ncbi:TAF5-like RNA polymerase II p300/CBP-associated factor-associated factor 65 kDa subunit 5L [Mytilus edulis]